MTCSIFRDKTGRNNVETASYIAVCCRVGRGERTGPRVLARRACSAFLLRYGRSKVCNTTCRFLGSLRNTVIWSRKRRLKLICVVHGEGTSVFIASCYNRRMFRANLSRCGRFSFVTQCVDFWAPYKIGRNYAKTAPHGAAPCGTERDKRDDCSMI